MFFLSCSVIKVIKFGQQRKNHLLHANRPKPYPNHQNHWHDEYLNERKRSVWDSTTFHPITWMIVTEFITEVHKKRYSTMFALISVHFQAIIMPFISTIFSSYSNLLQHKVSGKKQSVQYLFYSVVMSS